MMSVMTTPNQAREFATTAEALTLGYTLAAGSSRAREPGSGLENERAVLIALLMLLATPRARDEDTVALFVSTVVSAIVVWKEESSEASINFVVTAWSVPDDERDLGLDEVKVVITASVSLGTSESVQDEAIVDSLDIGSRVAKAILLTQAATSGSVKANPRVSAARTII
jgi:hypothetical protein